ncbi:DUF3892 domain-containing protein (plasmid) [Leuconostoc suionicum]|uniref:DUF3892 domain-containing protein n=1 Tax=Leuconostoc suionicum TaxID=1511761 RepID=UPI003747EB62
MGRYLVYEVKYVENQISGYKHIDRVKAFNEDSGSNLEFTREEVVDHLRQAYLYNTKFYTYFKKNGVWTVGQQIILFEGKYITTVSNNKKEDNLGELPEY